jgi:phytoene desaturase
MKKAVIIGAGLGGLATAIRLAADSWKVTVFDRQSFAGGKAGSNTLGKYRFDTGPSLLTMPEIFQDLFESAGKQMGDYLDLVPLDEVCNYFYPDGTRFSSYTDTKRFGKAIEANTSSKAEEIHRYLEYSKKIYDISAELFLKNSLHEGSTFRSKVFWKSLVRLFGIDPLRSMHKANTSLFTDPKLTQLFNRYATYNGSNPYKAPATLNIIPHVEYTLGSAAVKGGIYAIPQALHRLALELGVEFHLNEEVTRIVVEHPSGIKTKKEVRGVQTAKSSYEADVVVSNTDVFHTYNHLLKDIKAPQLKRYTNLEPSSSGLVFYFGIKKEIPELGLHNIFFSSDYEKEFDEIFNQRVIPEDPTIYINITSKVDKADAKGQGENWFVLINVPYHDGRDWEEAQNQVKQRIIQRLSKELGRNVEELIEVEDSMNPKEIEERTGSTYGSLYGISSNSRMAAFRRHPNRSKRHKGLFFVGGSVHPGGGMPLVLLSGKITSELIRRYHGKEE